ncbi:MAG: hypothetical protein WDN27_02900 [Candidatus Saccharibacteria bacterium]
MKRRLTLLLTLVGCWMLGALPAAAASFNGPRLYFAQASLTARAGSEISLPLYIDPNGAALDTVAVTVNFPAAQLTYVGFDASVSSFTSIVPSRPGRRPTVPSYSARAAMVRYNRARWSVPWTS